LAHDIFKSWGKLTRLGPYDIVVADPPSYQKGSFVATKDYVKIIRRLPTLVTAGGHALLCLNAPELEESFLMDLVTKEAPTLELVQRLPNPPTFPTKDPSRALKILLYRNTPILGGK
jgi:23S rRNA (cytosine1962-C5)-methyltransferase